jgi:proteasome lid subunit RPN8/RPN11
MRAEACRCYPAECCGVLLWRAGVPGTLAAVPFENQQARLHAADPVAFPRDARTAYSFDALRLERTLAQAARDGRALAAIFHSHPDHDAYFSATDRAAATPFGDATYPEAVQLVYAVTAGGAGAAAAFRWSADTREFVEVPLRVAEAP